jgi:hypothetical protein
MTYENVYRPTDAFRDSLEAEVLRSYRRAALRSIPDENRRRAWARAAVIAIISLGIGTTAGLASAQIRRSSERDSLLSAASVDLTLAKTRQALARIEADDVATKVRVGAADAQEAMRANANLRNADAQFTRAQLNVMEINATGRAPRDDFAAPLVGSRDFVKQRIQIEAVAAQEALAAAEETQAQIERRVRAGVATDVDRLSALSDVVQARATFAVLAEKLRLRQQFLEKNTPVETLMSELERAQLRQDVVVAQQQLELARARFALVEKQQRAGVVDDVQRLRAELELREREAELQRLALRLRGKP